MTHACVIIPTDLVVGPRGKVLDFHPASQVLTYAAAKEFLDELCLGGIHTEFIIAPTYRIGLCDFVERTGMRELVMMDSSEGYIRKKFIRITQLLDEQGIKLSTFVNREFICEIDEFRAKYPKPPLLEYFYRYMRTRTGLLMVEGKPEGGAWNYDHENRKFDRTHTPTDHWQPPETPELREAREFYSYT